MQLIEEFIELGRDNKVVFELGVLDPLNSNPPPVGITRCQVLVGSSLVDSAVTPALFDINTPSIVKLQFATAALPRGRHKSSLYIFDSQNTLGIKWADFMLNVK